MKNFSFKPGRLALLAVMLGSSLTLSAQNGPAGIGTTDGTSHLKLWLKADKGVYSDAGITPATNGQTVQQWNDQSGNGLHATQTASSSRPVFNSNGYNGFPTLTFGITSSWLNAALNISPSVNPNITVIAVTAFNSFGTTAPFSKIWGHDDGAYDRTVGLDPRSGNSTLAYFTGTSVGAITISSGFPAAGDPFISSSLYSPVSFTGYLQGVQGANDNTVTNGDGSALFTVGAINSSGIEPWLGNIVELMVYDTSLSLTQRINIENYLSAKYGTTLLDQDLYRMDDPANGNFDYDVVGIHTFLTDPLVINNARGSGRITLSNASNLLPGSSYFIGHDNGSLSPVTTDVPAGIVNRLGRIWAGTENNSDIGTLDLSFDLPELVVSDPANLRLLIDRNNNGSFADETPGNGVVSGFTRSGNAYTINVNMGDGQRFTIGSVSTLTLPVNLRSILVAKEGQSNKIQWKTDRETGFAYFDVQRSEDGTSFYSIGTVQVSKTTDAVKDYAFIDNTPLPANYYRLRMVDQKGQYTYSSVVKMIQTNKRFTISPNPATHIVSVTGLEGGAATIQLIDQNGKLLEQVKTTGLQHSFYLTKYPKGTYHIKVSTTKESFTETIIKQ